MKRFVNSPDTLVADGLDGFAAAHAELIVLAPGRKYVRRRAPRRDKVTLISGGGSGHEPMHAGFVGHGMLDAACPGQIFTSPTPDQIVEAAEALSSELGVLFIVKNYSGDRMNFDMATEGMTGRHRTLIVEDDVSDEATSRSVGRRGVAGALVVEKVIGAAAEAGASLETCLSLGAKVKARTRSLGVALSYCNLSQAARSFSLGPDEMELGVGIHGEPGRRIVKLATADEVAAELADAIFRDLGEPDAGEALLFVNGFGGTPLNELYVMFNSGRRALTRKRLVVKRSLVGNFVTSLDMAGVSFTVCLLDDELAALWDAPVRTASLRW